MAELLRRPTSLLLHDAEVDGGRVDVLVRDGRVAAVAPVLSAARVDVVDARGGALLPGLHDHHVHLLATAAAAASVLCGPPVVTDRDGLARALAQGGRGVGYVEDVAGPLDRALLDAVAPDRQVRVQHRSGALWALNTLTLREADLDVADGRLWRGDPRLDRLRGPWPDLAAVGRDLALAGVLGVADATPDLAAVGRDLALAGVLGVADATPDLAPEALARLDGADLPQRLLLLGAPGGWPSPRGCAGPHKVLLHDEGDLDLPALVRRVQAAHAAGRAVALHTVTRASLLLVLLALQEAGPLAGDRVEHAGVVPPELVPLLQDLGVAVVTQPPLAAAHGDDHLRDASPDDVPWLWPYASLLAAGVQVPPSTDAPTGRGTPTSSCCPSRSRWRSPSPTAVWSGS